jgi:hypothetical protein
LVLDVFATLIPSYETVSPPPQPQSQEKQILQEQQQQQHKKKSKNVYGIWCVDLHQLGYGGYRPRLWFRPGDMHYTDRHYDFKRRDSDDPSTGQIYADVSGLWYYTTTTIAAHRGARSAEKNTSGALKVWNQSLSK